MVPVPSRSSWPCAQAASSQRQSVPLLGRPAARGQLCKACIDRQFWQKTMMTALLGWWGLISFLITPFVLLHNVIRYLCTVGMRPASARASRSEARSDADRPPQLVGQSCVHCGERIACVVGARFCPDCGLPAHDDCVMAQRERGVAVRTAIAPRNVRPVEGRACPSCGAALAVQ